jgi:uncharacterized RDD family membrane protein YckC
MEEELLDDFQASTALGEMVYASFPKRLFATGIDLFILLGIYMIFSDFILDFTQPSFIYGYLELLSFITIALYVAFAESSTRQGTFGKQFLKIKVVNKQGKRIEFMHALGRFGVKWSLSPIIFVSLLSSRKNNDQHGDILDTYVIEK